MQFLNEIEQALGSQVVRNAPPASAAGGTPDLQGGKAEGLGQADGFRGAAAADGLAGWDPLLNKDGGGDPWVGLQALCCAFLLRT